MDYLPVTSLSGIGPVYGGRLNNAGYHTVKDIHDVFKSYNFDRNKCENWLNRVCSANSRYAAMCFESVRGMREPSSDGFYSAFEPYTSQRKNQSYRCESPTYEPQRTSTPLYTPQQSPQRSVFTSVQQSPASSSASGISKAEVMQMMAEFRNKQDAMATQITKLEQDKSKSDQYIKTLESKIKLMDEKTIEVQKRQDAKIAELTKNLQEMNRIEQYQKISSSIYLLSQKFDDMLVELNELKQRTKIHSYVKALEKKIELIKTSTTNLQKQQDEKFLELTNKISDTSALDQHKEVSKSIVSLTEKLDDMMKQQNEYKPSTRASLRVDAKLKQLKEDIHNISNMIRNGTKNNTEKNEKLTNNDTKIIDDPNVQKKVPKLLTAAGRDKNGSKRAELL